MSARELDELLQKTPASPRARAARSSGCSPSARAFFSPGEDCLDAIRDAFDGARRPADVCVFTITDDRIRDAMLAARRRVSNDATSLPTLRWLTAA